MAYRLKFRPSDERVFEIIYEGFHVVAKPSTREEHRLANAILDKLEQVSVALDETIVTFNPEDSNAPKARRLLPSGGFAIFEDAQMEFLRKAIAKITAPPAISKVVVAAQDFLDALPHGDAKMLTQEEA